MNADRRQIIHEVVIHNIPGDERDALEEFFNEHGAREREGFVLRLVRNKNNNAVG